MARFYADIERALPVGHRGRRRLAPIPATLCLALANLAIFGADYFSADTGVIHSITQSAIFDPTAVWSGEWWRLITHAFIHSDLDHLVSNLVGLVLFGYWVEPAIGRTRFLFIYLVSTVAGGFADLVIDPAPALGASAAVYGIAGVYVSLLWRTPGSVLRRFASLQRWFWTLFTLWCISGGWDDPEIDYLAHLFGLAAGIWFGSTLPVRGWTSRRARRILQLRRASFAAGLVVASVLSASAFWQPGWWYARAESAADEGDWQTVEKHLQVLERCANPAAHHDAYVLMEAAYHFWDRVDRPHALALAKKTAPTLEDPMAYVIVGDLQIDCEHPREQAALSSYNRALSMDPGCVDALVAAAELEITASDSIVFNPQEARRLAKRAVMLTDAQEPTALWTLSQSQFACGNTKEAIRLMEKALRLRPEDPQLYESALLEMKNAGSE